MKRLYLVVALLLLAACFVYAGKPQMMRRYNSITRTWSSFPHILIYDAQYVAPESLHVADSLQLTNSGRWMAQVTTQYYGDTIVVTGLVLAPYKVITYTNHGWTMLIQDTAKTADKFRGALVRCGSGNAGADTVQAIADGFANVEQGDIINLTCRVDEFPTSSMNSATQLTPIPGYNVEIVSSANPLPAKTLLTVPTFYSGAYPGGTTNYTNGEPYEGAYVILKNLTVTSIVNAGRGTWDMVDQSGNHISDYDASYYFTFGSSETPPTVPDTSVTHFHLPPVGATIDSIKGFITIASGGENPRGYRICPLFIGDVAYGVTLPSITTHRRYPVVVTSNDTVHVQARVLKISGGYDIGSVDLHYSINNGAWTSTPMSIITLDSTYDGVILDQDGNPFPANTFVKYYIKATDVNNNSAVLVNASSLFAHDSSKGYFFYNVLDRPLTIRDIQYTPFSNGRSSYVGGTVTVSGIVTADTSDIGLTPLNTGGTNAWFIQDGNAKWSGIWVVQQDSISGAALAQMRRGDSVTVTGGVGEYTNSFNQVFENTRIVDSLVVIHSSGHAVPQPVNLTTATFGFHGNGDTLPEPYEGMLVRITNATVTSINPIFSDNTEYGITDGSGVEMIVRRDGNNTYSNEEGDTTSGKTHIFHVGDKIDTMIGVIYGSFSRYKLEPRKDADFVAGEPYHYIIGWNLVSVGRVQLPQATGYNKSVLYPNAVSQAFYYNGSYQISSVLNPKVGYWIKLPFAQTIHQLGVKHTLDTINVVPGWNLIGALGNPLPVANISTLSPAGNHLGTFYEYEGFYIVQDSLLPAHGYWVKADSAGYFVESASSIIPKANPDAQAWKKFNTLTITDRDGLSQKLYFGMDATGTMKLRDYEMPPAGPNSESFDARFASGRILEAYPKYQSQRMNYGINAMALNGPVTVTWNITSPEGRHFFLTDNSNGKVLKSRELINTGSVTIGTSGAIHLNLQVDGSSAVPKVYSLSQNYPNPFNPTTKFDVGIPQTSNLEVAVYNILGQRVATLVNEVREGGLYTITWDGLSQNGVQVASGVYFVRVNAIPATGSGKAFTAVQKMVMMK